MTFTVALPKWPLLTVAGKKVTEDQAKEILIRTSTGYYSCNDREWEQTIYEIFGLKTDEYGHASYESLLEFRERLGVLPLNYLTNDQIASSYIGGPHGWCSWGGRIACNSFNIGKWPSVEEVTADWQAIATAFPYLDLRSQLYNGESSEDNIKPVVEFRVVDGKVEVSEPQGELIIPMPIDIESSVGMLLSPGRERGCSEQTLREAYELTKKRLDATR